MAHPKRDERCGLEVEHNEVGLHPRRDAADRVLEIKRARRAPGGEIEGVRGRQRAPVQLGRLVGLVHRLQHRERGAGAQVGRESHAHRARRLERIVDIQIATAEEEVRRRAMRDRGAAVVAALQLRLGEPDAMAVDRAPPEQAIVVVDVEVPLALRKQLANPSHFAPALRDVRLHEAVRMLGLERAGGFELSRACSWPRSAA